MKIETNMRFIDLFAGLGGFHLALNKLGHKCVFASELDTSLRELYKRNFGIEPAGDIRSVKPTDIPEHDILCAGFPCQPFSKAGSQDGLENTNLGNLYKDIIRIIAHHKPRYFLLENVPNLERHNEGKTWEIVESQLRMQGYDIKHEKLSPHYFGIPQVRQRMYIVGTRDALDEFVWPETKQGVTTSVKKILDRRPAGAKAIPEQISRCLDVWQEFLDQIPSQEKIPSPLWSMEFGATYPYEHTTPKNLFLSDLRNYKGSHGRSLDVANSNDDVFELLPAYARGEEKNFPQWKINFIRKNREFYARHKAWLDKWIPKIKEFPSSLQKLEWNCQGEKNREIRRYLLQLRPSGVRVKRPTTAPSLVAMTVTQVPIIGWEERYMTPDECKRLQSMDGLTELPAPDSRAYKALGNAINVDVAVLVAEALMGDKDSSLESTSHRIREWSRDLLARTALSGAGGS